MGQFNQENNCCPPCPSPTPVTRRRRQCADPSQPVDLRGQCDHAEVWLNAQQSFVASCPSGFEGEPVTVTVPPQTVASILSQADADAMALAIAQDEAETELQCAGLYFNAEQTATVSCPFGPDKQATVPAGTYSSSTSQDAANAAAYAAATAQAQSLCST